MRFETKKAEALLKELYRFNASLGWILAIRGIEYFRCVEYAWVFQRMPNQGPLRILDIGPWRSPLPLFLARKGHYMSITDLPEGIALQRRLMARVPPGLRVISRVLADNGKNGALPFADSSFDLILCISTIEHLPGDGDTLLSGEIHRLLGPGGSALITVPYRLRYHEGQMGQWFERRYDRIALEQRLIGSHPWASEDLYFFRDHRTAWFTRLYWKVPKVLRTGLGWLQIWVALHYLRRDRASEEDAGLACLHLRKPQGGSACAGS